MAAPVLAEYQFTDEEFRVNHDMKSAFDLDGCIMVRNLLSENELEKLKTALLESDSLLKRAWDIDDGDGKTSRMVLWRNTGDDVTAMHTRCEKMAGTCETLLGGEVYHYHTKLMMKEPRTGGKHLWHQDYGYWYQNGFLKPDMMTVFVALDKCVKENGCLKVLKGSHRCGRIDHEMAAGQTQASLERVNYLSEHFQLLDCEMNPGDALFFHCNLLHTSDQNPSDMRRYALLCAYNRADNKPVNPDKMTGYTPLEKVPNSALLDCDCYELDPHDIMDPATDKNVKAKLVK